MQIINRPKPKANAMPRSSLFFCSSLVNDYAVFTTVVDDALHVLDDCLW
jgi:hypothetical protein